MTKIKNASYFEHIQLHRAKVSRSINSLYESEIKERSRVNVDFDMREMYSLSQVTQKEVNAFPDKKESQVFKKLRELRSCKKQVEKEEEEMEEMEGREAMKAYHKRKNAYR